MKRQFYDFDRAKIYVGSLRLRSRSEYWEYIKSEDYREFLPKDPPNYYKELWEGWANFLGESSMSDKKSNKVSYEEAREFARTLNLTGSDQWRKYVRGDCPDLPDLPNSHPKSPKAFYEKRNEWKGWIDFLIPIAWETVDGSRYVPFEQARDFARKLNLKNNTSWIDYVNGECPDLPPLPIWCPRRPDKFYKGGQNWKGWPDFLGTKNWSPKVEFMPFNDARLFARSLGLMHKAEWIRYQEGRLDELPSFPEGMPSRPDLTYTRLGQWTSWEDFLNSDWKFKKVNFLKYKKAKAFVHQLRLKSSTQWRNYCKGEYSNLPSLPKQIPANPVLAYPKEWKSYGDWLGTGRVANRYKEYWSFDQARRFVHDLELKTGTEWNLYCKGKLLGHGIKPKEIPNRPEYFYDEWDGLADWLGNGKEKGKGHVFWDYDKAHAYSVELGLRTRRDWYAFRRGEIKTLSKPNSNIPGDPSRYYKDKGWVSWRVFLTGKDERG